MAATVSTRAPAGGGSTSTNGAGTAGRDTREVCARAPFLDSTIPTMTEERWRSLSVQSVAILRQVLVPIHLEGEKVSETAKRLGIPQSSIRLLVQYFRDEISELGQPD